MNAKKLRAEEWNFESLSGDCARGAFLYEYFRHSDKLRMLILRLREMDDPCMLGEWPEGYRPMTIKRRELVRTETKGKTFEKLAEALMNCPKFPKTPALKLRDQAWILDLQRSPAVRSCSGEIISGQDMKDAMGQIVGRPGIEYHFEGSIKAEEFESVFPLVIDWRKPDAQIVHDFSVRVLSLRPERFSKLDKISPIQAAFGNLTDKLPFKPLTALNWLGVLRRFEAAGKNWGKYREFYSGAMRERLEKQNSDSESWRRKQLRDCERARTILDWFEASAKAKLMRKQFR